MLFRSGSQALKLGVDIVYDKQAIVDNYNKADGACGLIRSNAKNLTKS